VTAGWRICRILLAFLSELSDITEAHISDVFFIRSRVFVTRSSVFIVVLPYARYDLSFWGKNRDFLRFLFSPRSAIPALAELLLTNDMHCRNHYRKYYVICLTQHAPLYLHLKWLIIETFVYRTNLTIFFNANLISTRKISPAWYAAGILRRSCLFSANKRWRRWVSAVLDITAAQTKHNRSLAMMAKEKHRL